MDFSQIAHAFGVELTSVAGIFCVLALLVIPATWVIYRHRDALGAALHRLFLSPWYGDAEPDKPLSIRRRTAGATSVSAVETYPRKPGSYCSTWSQERIPSSTSCS